MQKVFPAKSIVRCNPTKCLIKDCCLKYVQHLNKPESHATDVSVIELSRNPEAVDCSYFCSNTASDTIVT